MMTVRKNRYGLISMFQASDFHNLLQQLETFFAESVSPMPVTKPVSPQVLRDRLPLALPTEGKPLDALNADIARYLAHTVKTAHPSYFNQLWGGFNAACFMGDVLTSATNTSMYTHEVAPVATLIEKTLIAKMGELIGYDNPEGQFTTGGSNGNLMAIAIARHQAMPNLKKEGTAGAPKLVAFVSEEAHYSFTKAAQLLGLGSQQLWKVPVDEQGAMVPSALDALIALARSQGAKPFFVAGTAATTVRGVYDPFLEIAPIAKREGLWFHIDGAWGASVLLSAEHRYLMAGVELADSVVWDAHKMMGMTLMCSMLIVKQRGRMLSAFSADDTDYLFHSSAEEPADLGPQTIHCGRRVDAVKLWLAWQHLGDRGWASLIDRYFALAAKTEAFINAQDALTMVLPRQSVNLCFQYVPQDKAQDANVLTLKVRDMLMQKGLAMVNYAQLDGKVFFRLVICNNQTRMEDIESLLENIVAIARQIEENAAIENNSSSQLMGQASA